MCKLEYCDRKNLTDLDVDLDAVSTNDYDSDDEELFAVGATLSEYMCQRSEWWYVCICGLEHMRESTNMCVFVCRPE